jgi:hypothetical protein
MTEATKAQFPKQVVGAIMDVDMNPMPPKIIGKEACL